MKESLNNQGSTVYGLADTLRIHIRYDEDDSIEDELNKFFWRETQQSKQDGSRRVREIAQASAEKREANQSNKRVHIGHREYQQGHNLVQSVFKVNFGHYCHKYSNKDHPTTC